MRNNIEVINLEGLKEPFSSQKVYRSAINAGANKKLAEEITRKIEKKVYPDIQTSKIFEEVKRLLREKNFKASLKFDLKWAMKRLGPTGFPFEKYIKSIFENRGFKTKINLYIKGKCSVHEIDFLAEQKETIYLGECKYRNFFDKSVGINIALSNYARFLDLKQSNFLKKFNGSKIKSILVTNAKFSNYAINYSICAGVNLLGWKYPRQKGLETIIEQNKLYPITILPSLSVEMAEIFISKEKMLASDVLTLNTDSFLGKPDIVFKKLEKLKKEAEILIKNND